VILESKGCLGPVGGKGGEDERGKGVDQGIWDWGVASGKICDCSRR